MYDTASGAFHGNLDTGFDPRLALSMAGKSWEGIVRHFEFKAEQLKSTPAEKKPSALASKPGWRKKSEGQKPFRHREYRED